MNVTFQGTPVTLCGTLPPVGEQAPRFGGVRADLSVLHLPELLGLVSLMGIIVRNGIIMFDYAEELRATEHLTAREAIHQSASRRMRPIFLTSAAASMGVIPMILGGSGLWMPMGSVICFGTLISMLFILTIVPIAYLVVFEGTEKRREQRNLIEKQ